MKVVNYFKENYLVVDVEIIKVEKLFDNYFSVDYRYIENGKPDDYILSGFAVEENGKYFLYHSKEEFFYDDKKPFVEF